MSALCRKAMQEQLSAIMAALTTAAVAEICELVAEGYAELQLEISRKHRENEDLKKKLHLIESIVGGGGGGGGGAGPAAGAGTPPQRDGGAAVPLREEPPEVVLIKDEDSDTNDTFGEGNRTPADGGTAASREVVLETPVSRSMKRRWSGHEESSSEQLTPSTGMLKTSGGVYTLDSPRSQPGCSGQFGGEEVEADSSQMDPDVQLVHQECSLISPGSSRHTYFGSSSLAESLTNRAEVDLSLTWTKHSKCQVSFPQFHQNENVDVDAFGLKLLSVSGSTSTGCQLSESSNSGVEYEDADTMNLALYRDPSGRSQVGQLSSGCSGKRFTCSICNKTYATTQNLDVHMRIHTGERPFSCIQCGKKFTQSAHLKSHLSVHSGERPYACTLCSRSFIVKYSLKLHMKKCHPAVRGDGCVL